MFVICCSIMAHVGGCGWVQEVWSGLGEDCGGDSFEDDAAGVGVHPCACVAVCKFVRLRADNSVMLIFALLCIGRGLSVLIECWVISNSC